MGNCENCTCQNNDPTPDQIAFVVEKFAEAAVLLHKNKILSEDVITKANEIALIALDKLSDVVKNMNLNKNDGPSPLPEIN